MNTLHKVLNINDLYSMDIFSFYNMHHFGMRNRPFQGLKQAISHPEMGFIGTRNGQYQNAGWLFSDYVIGYIIRRLRQKQPSKGTI